MKVGNLVRYKDGYLNNTIGICISGVERDVDGFYAYFYWSDDSNVCVEYLRELEVIA